MSPNLIRDSMISPPEAAAGGCQSTSRIPVVALDVDVVTDTVAARLATSLLGHVLYLKNQIPLPIVQLSRMTNRKAKTKTAKMKADLLSSFDTLASHLVTTFSALSTALARAKASSSSDDDVHVSRAYMTILVGPSLGTARSKVIYGVDNFATRVWGTRDDHEEAEEGSSGEECPEDSEDDEDDKSSEDGSLEGTESDEDAPDGDDGENVESFQDEEQVKDEVEKSEEAPRRPENDHHHDHPPPSPTSHQSYAEEQRFLHAADRLLARVLASADTEGHGISNEMSPSQIHILLRAPRRFTHPVWVPRQNISKQMEATLTDFINQSWPPQQSDELPAKKKKSVEGVWVTAKNGLRGPPVSLDEKIDVPEEDEMIWWSWDGKLVGFTDW